MRLRRIGNRILRRSRISLGNWSFTPKSVPFSSLPRLFTCSFCLKYPNLATIGRGLGAPGFFAPIRWTLSKQMFSTVSSGSFRYVLIKFLTVASGSSSADSGMPENTRLSLMLRAWRSMTVSFIFLFSSLRWVIFSVRDLTESRRDAFSAASVSTCCWLNSSDSLRDLNSRCRISRNPWQPASSVPLLPRLGRASSLWGGKMGVLDHVSIIEASTRSQFEIDTPFLSWPLLSSYYKGLPFLLNWIYATLTISCGFDRGTNGGRPSTPPQATMSIW